MFNLDTAQLFLIGLNLLNAIILLPYFNKGSRTTRVWISLHFLNLLILNSDILTLDRSKNIANDTVLVGTIFSLLLRLNQIIMSVIRIRKSFISFRGLVAVIVDNVILLITGYAVLYWLLVSYNINAFSTSKFTLMSYLYYSVTTFTTTGYGDISPVSDVAKACASSEMLLGFFVSTFIMAILVTKFLENRSTR